MNYLLMQNSSSPVCSNSSKHNLHNTTTTNTDQEIQHGIRASLINKEGSKKSVIIQTEKKRRKNGEQW